MWHLDNGVILYWPGEVKNQDIQSVLCLWVLIPNHTTQTITGYVLTHGTDNQENYVNLLTTAVQLATLEFNKGEGVTQVLLKGLGNSQINYFSVVRGFGLIMTDPGKVNADLIDMFTKFWEN